MKLKVLYVHHSPHVAGATMSLFYLLEQLDRKKYDPLVLFNSEDGPAIDMFAKGGIEVLRDPRISFYQHGTMGWLGLRSLRPWELLTRALLLPMSAHRFQHFLRQHPFDLVHLNSSVQIPAALGAKWAGVPVVWHIREVLHSGYLGLRRALVRRCIERCAGAAIAISQYDAAQLIRSDKVHIIYNFVDFRKFDRRLTGHRFRQELSIPPDSVIVGMLGGVGKVKGAQVLIQAAKQVKEDGRRVLFLIAGMPPQGAESPRWWKRSVRRACEASGLLPNVERQCQELIKKHRMGDIVRFVGVRTDVQEMLAACAVIVWPATASHFARPIIEAGAMARPVVASDFPSSRELVCDHHTGLLVPPSDAMALAKAILYLLDHPDEAQKMREAAYALALRRYDARRNAEATFSLYEKVIRENLRRHCGR
jgi:glycosyltransferase involved in cell wall biosynthesis